MLITTPLTNLLLINPTAINAYMLSSSHPTHIHNLPSLQAKFKGPIFCLNPSF